MELSNTFTNSDFIAIFIILILCVFLYKSRSPTTIVTIKVQAPSAPIQEPLSFDGPHEAKRAIDNSMKEIDYKLGAITELLFAVKHAVVPFMSRKADETLQQAEGNGRRGSSSLASEPEQGSRARFKCDSQESPQDPSSSP